MNNLCLIIFKMEERKHATEIQSYNNTQKEKKKNEANEDNDISNDIYNIRTMYCYWVFSKRK